MAASRCTLGAEVTALKKADRRGWLGRGAFGAALLCCLVFDGSSDIDGRLVLSQVSLSVLVSGVAVSVDVAVLSSLYCAAFDTSRSSTSLLTSVISGRGAEVTALKKADRVGWLLLASVRVVAALLCRWVFDGSRDTARRLVLSQVLLTRVESDLWCALL